MDEVGKRNFPPPSTADPRFQSNEVVFPRKIELGGILHSHNAFVLRDKGGERIQKSCFTGRRSATDENILASYDRRSGNAASLAGSVLFLIRASIVGIIPVAWIGRGRRVPRAAKSRGRESRQRAACRRWENARVQVY